MHASGINLRSGITAPFVLWLIAGLVPWFFFQEVLSGGTNALMEYSYLVKKVVFQIDILPIIKLISALFVHLFFIAFTIILYACYGYYPDLYTPIMWNIDGMELNPILITILKLNPMYYIVAGYRDSLINKAGFWEQPGMTIYYWILTIVLFIIGTKIFKKLKPHFADVL